MKPRLDVAPLTKEDFLIWRRINNRFYDQWPDKFVAPSEPHMDADRRDADLMLQLAVCKDLYNTEDGPWDIANWVLDREGLRHP